MDADDRGAPVRNETFWRRTAPLIFIILVLLILAMWSKVQVLPRVLEYLGTLAGQAGWWLTVITAFFTVISGTIYLYNHRELISKSWNEKGQ